MAVVRARAERVGFYSTVEGAEVGSLDNFGFQPDDMALDPRASDWRWVPRYPGSCRCGIWKPATWC